jgi:hypothetical protein
MKNVLRCAIAAVVALTSAAAGAFFFPTAPRANVVEYYNTQSGRYFITASDAEKSAIESGAAGPGWVRTDYGFIAGDNFPAPPDPAFGPCAACADVMRFRWSPAAGIGTHFFTIDRAESQVLQGLPGWTYEGVAFHAFKPAGGASCETAFALPVYRLYNGAGGPDHRYVGDPAERARMLASGWSDEGAAFCTFGWFDTTAGRGGATAPLYTGTPILPGSECEGEPRYTAGCIAVNNLPVPDGEYTTLSDADRALFSSITSRSTDIINVTPDGGGLPYQQLSFVQFGFDERGMGIHIDTRNRGSSNYSSIIPTVKLATVPASATDDERFFPWHRFATYERELAIVASAAVARLNVRGANSYAYGHTTVGFLDGRSSHRFLFNILAYGNIAGGSEFIAPDASSGVPIVGTSFGAPSPYGRNLSESAKFVAAGTQVPAPPFWTFEFHMNRDEFQKVLASARTLDAALSTDPDDYMVDRFLFKNEVVGDGEIGLTLRDVGLSYPRR